MDARRALECIVDAVRRGRIEWSVHVLDESMPDDDVGVEDVLHLLTHVESIVPVDGDKKWKAYGLLLNGDAYAVVLRIHEDGSLVVITCHEPP